MSTSDGILYVKMSLYLLLVSFTLLIYFFYSRENLDFAGYKGFVVFFPIIARSGKRR